MIDKNNPRTGLIEIDGQKRLNFYLDNYKVIFMHTDNSSIKLDGQFVYGRTYANEDIAIFKGYNQMIMSYFKQFNTLTYMILTDNHGSVDWKEFNCIEFRGGILNNLFFCNAMKHNYVDGKIAIELKDDSRNYKFSSTDGECEVLIRSTIKNHSSLTGDSISNNEVLMELKFDNCKKIETAFEYIQKIKDVLSIMTFRKNICFDEIHLCNKNKDGFSKMQLFLKEDVRNTDKDITNNITFNDLNNSVAELFSLVFKSKENSPAYEIDFLPDSDKELGIINNTKIRLICSALECEASFIRDLLTNEDEGLNEIIELDKLKKKIKDEVNSYKKSENKLSQKTYDLILSNISNWSMSASDKICNLYDMYEEEMIKLNHSTIDVNSKKILDFIKYRNNITHGTYRIIDEKIAVTAYLLQGLVYCCLLTRIGVDRNTIFKLCAEGKILT